MGRPREARARPRLEWAWRAEGIGSDCLPEMCDGVVDVAEREKNRAYVGFELTLVGWLISETSETAPYASTARCMSPDRK